MVTKTYLIPNCLFITYMTVVPVVTEVTLVTIVTVVTKLSFCNEIHIDRIFFYVVIFISNEQFFLTFGFMIFFNLRKVMRTKWC